MNVNDFIQQREADWQRLEQLIKANQGRSRLSAVQVRELGELYRAASSDLAQARRDYPNQRVILYLNQLLTRTHSFIYQQDVDDYRSAWRYFTHTIPQTFRQTAGFTLLSFLMFIVPAILGFSLAYRNPAVAEALGLAAQRDILESHETWTDIPPEERSLASTLIMTNNIRVAILAFGGGIMFGIFTFYMMAMNGLIIGAVLGLAAHYGMGDALLDFIFAHGVVELSVIFMAGGAGLQLGWALLNPGDYSRRNALILAARRAVPLAVISVLLLMGAGLIEGFISPSGLPFIVKVMVGLGYGAVMYSYLLLMGRDGDAIKEGL